MKSSMQTLNEAKTRQMIVSRKGFDRKSNCYVFFPAIQLSGKWLEESGFKNGQVVNITCEERRLIITVAKE